jgi:type IV pilus assembly protein PilM
MLNAEFNSFYGWINGIYKVFSDRLKKAHKFQLNSSKTQIGLDIGSDSIKLAEVRIKGESGQLLYYKIIPISHLKGRPIEEKSAEISQILRSSLKNRDKVPIYTAVSGSDVIIKSFNISRLSGAKLRNAIFWASKKYVPFPLEEAYFDYRVIGDIEERDIKKKEVMVVAAARQLIHNTMSLFEKSRLNISGITVTPFALWNFLKSTKTELSNIALIDIGAENTTIAIFQNNSLKFAREIVTSGYSITDSIADSTSLSFEEAERLKKEYGLSKKTTPDGFDTAIIPVVERLINEIQRSLSFYKDKHPEFMLEKIYLTGGTAKLRGLAQCMKNRLNTVTEVINPFDKLEKISLPDSEEIDQVAPVFTKAISLALKTDEGIDLLPPEAKHQRIITRLLPILRVSAMFIILFCFILTVDILARVHIKKKSLNLWESNMQRLNHLLTSPGEIQINSDRYKIMQETLDEMEKKEIIDPYLLKEITNIIPQNIVLENLSAYSPEEAKKHKDDSRNIQFRIKGIVCGKKVDLEVDLLQFLVKLDFSPFLDNPVLLEKESDILAGRDILRFVIHCDLKL